MMTNPISLPTPWITLKEAWTCSPWTSKALLDFARKGVLKAEERGGTWHFEPEGFYHAMREELALEGWLSVGEVAAHHDVAHDTLLELIKDHTLYALYTDVDWYIKPQEMARIPTLIKDCHIHTTTLPVTQGVEVPEAIEVTQHVRLPSHVPAVSDVSSAHSRDWLVFKEAVHQSAFTHAELHQALREGKVNHCRNAQGQLMIARQGFHDLHPPSTWQPLEPDGETGSSPQRRQVLKRLWSGQLEGRLMGGLWYVAPHAR